jgi:hypothetical protein
MTLRPTSFRSFAKRMGMSLSAVQRAAVSGRLSTASVGRDAKGRRVLLDPARAAQELHQHTRPRSDVILRSVRSNGNEPRPSALARVTLRERLARARVIEAQLARQLGELVAAREVELSWSRQIVAARSALLGVPARAKALMPHTSGSDLATWDKLIRASLEELSAGQQRPRVQETTTP